MAFTVEDDEADPHRAAHKAAKDRTGFRLLFAKRSEEVLQPGTWGTWGGAVDPRSSPARTVVKEAREEAGIPVKLKHLVPLVVFRHAESGFHYHNFLAVIEDEVVPEMGWETEDYAWCEMGNWPDPLHFGAEFLLADEESLDKIRQAILAGQAPATRP